MPLIIAVNGTPAPALALELLRVATGQTQYSVRSDAAACVGVQIGDSFIPTDRRRPPADLFFTGATPRGVFRRRRSWRRTVKPGAFANQVAIIGATAVGISDVAATPAATRMDGVEVQAQLIENILGHPSDSTADGALVGSAGIYRCSALMLIVLCRGSGRFMSW